ncbi:MAG TPA: right-handed parallel beta-helix repeat-containing protein [bacterium]|nr:right-handed parallel beta-helix repeat-containing protein [bacterium]
MRTAVVVSIILAAFAMLPMVVLAQPTVTISTDDDTYQSGDTIEVSLSAQNFDDAMSVAVYIGLLGSDGDIYTLQFEGWSDRIEPWIPEIWVPCRFNMNCTAYWWFDVPCLMPPIVDEALYHFVAGLTRSGTFEFVCDISYAPFEVRYGPPTDCYVDAEDGDDSNDGSEGAPWQTITHGLDSVTGTEDYPVTIHVGAGTYAESTNGETFPLSMESWVSLSGEHRDTTVLDAEGQAYHVISCEDVNNFTIENLTISGGKAEGPSNSDQSGGGIACSFSSPTISNNRITGNLAAYGAGIYCWESSPTISNNKITANRARDDWAYLAGYGGGIYYRNSSPIIANNRISGNWATYYGGGIDCTSSSAAISNNRISWNTADSGGGICCKDGSAAILNNTFIGNRATVGAGICSCNNSSLDIESNTIVWNMARDGGGIVCKEDSSAAIIDCIIWGNGDDLFNCSASYCCIQDSDSGTGNISDYPMFGIGPLGDYYLDPDSPCIDTGSQSASAAGLSNRTTQADGTPDTGTVDMGFHYPIP